MAEIINTYLLSNPNVLVPMDRDDFYSEQIAEYKKNGKASRAVEVVNILIFNSRGELIIQKRSFAKKHNPGLLDKSIGGHIQNGDTADYTVMVETVQELQTPSIVLKADQEFEKTYTLLKEYTDTIAIAKSIDAPVFSEPKKIIQGEKISIANKMFIYFALYDGKIRPADQEAKGVLFYTIDELEKEMTTHPDIFTDDLHFILKKYQSEIQNFLKLFVKK